MSKGVEQSVHVHESMRVHMSKGMHIRGGRAYLAQPLSKQSSGNGLRRA